MQPELVKRLNISHDCELVIATGSSRKAVKWRNGKTKWSTLVNKLQRTSRTHETMKQYIKMTKAEQGQVKDVGGFVGGHLEGGRRKANTVVSRTLVTLDLDHLTADNDVWELVEILFPYAAAIYSTHSHTPKEPRLRFLFPLSRPVSPVEYQAVSRKVAELFGLDLFDDTTFEPHRLMFWPSTAADGEYIFEYQDLDVLDPDEILNEYVDYSDPAEWPRSSREASLHLTLAEKQGNPLEKPGMVGLFNRSYTIPEAIETFLPDVYTPHSKGRYSYKDGTTAGGLVLYQDGLFAYSHHGSDIVGGQLVNAYDLVRLHKYGAQDLDASPDTPINRLPSSTAMRQFAKDDPRIKEAVYTEKVSDAFDDFDDVLDVIGEEEGEPAAKDADNGWVKKLTLDGDDNFEATRTNIMTILNHDPNLKGKFALNMFSQRAVIRGDLPWRKREPGRELYEDLDDAGLRNYLETIYGISHVQKTQDALAQVLHQNAFHPIRNYLDGLEWDGEKRAERLLIESLGAEDTELNRVVSRKTLVAAVARIYNPGCKMDYMLTLAGRQGLGKSSLFGRLGGDWFSDSLTTVTGKEAYEQLQGAWLVEMGELSATRKADLESTKHFLTKRIDRFRVAYGRHVSDFPRQCIFIGTTNDEEFLKDPTGNRRFWVVPVGKQSIKKHWGDITDYEVDQIWAEAVHYFEAGEQLYLEEALEEEMSQVRMGHFEQSHILGMIQEHLDRPVPAGFSTWTVEQRFEFLGDGDFDDLVEGTEEPEGLGNLMLRDRICALEIWVELLNGSVNKFPTHMRREITAAIQQIGEWEVYDGAKDGRMRFGSDFGKQKAYIRKVTNDFDDLEFLS